MRLPTHRIPHRAFTQKEKTETVPYLLLFLAALGLWAFVEIADEVREGDAFAFDRALLVALRAPSDLSDPVGPAWVEEMVRDFTALGGAGVLTLVSLVSVGFLAVLGKRRAAVFVFLAVGLGQIFSAAAKAAFDRPRPDIVPHDAYTVTSSFPSGHSMMSAIVYLTLGLLMAGLLPGRRVKAYLIAVSLFLTVAVGSSRVYLGVHWPSDVLGGWTAGAAWALACWMVERRLKNRGAVEPETGARA